MPQPLMSIGRRSGDEVEKGALEGAVYVMAIEIEDAPWRRETGYAWMARSVGGKPISGPKARPGVDGNGRLRRPRHR
jgi:hypothetical protein